MMDSKRDFGLGRVDGKGVDIKQPLLDVLAVIPENVPESFKDGAVKVAAWITAMDSGVNVGGEDFDRWSKQVRENHIIPLSSLNLCPEDAFPKWLLLDDEENKKLSPEGYEESKALFKKLTDGLEVEAQEENNGIHVNFRPKEVVLLDRMKVYVDENEGLRILKNGCLEGFLKSGEGLPSDFKWYEGQIYMYFLGKEDSAETVEAKMSELGIDADVAQDTFHFEIRDSKIFGPGFDETKDSSFARWEIPAGKYNQKDFLSGYLKFCLTYGRNPSEPFLNSFAYVDSDGSIDEKSERMVKFRAKIKTPLVVRSK